MRFLSCFFVSFLLLFSGCKRENISSVPEIDETILQEGDLIFRRGLGIASRLVLAAERGGSFSHVGIIVKDSSKWYVIHAVPGETDDHHPTEIIKKETIMQFFAPDKSVSGAILRLDTNDFSISYRAAQTAQELLLREIPFDHEYDTEDSTKMYCTELLYFAYKKAGVDITEGRRSSYPGLRQNFILPRDITDNLRLKTILHYPQ